MKKTIFSVFLSLLLILSLTACSANQEDSTVLRPHWECVGGVYEGIPIYSKDNEEIEKACLGVTLDLNSDGSAVLTKGLRFLGTLEEAEKSESSRKAYVLTIHTVAEHSKDGAEAPTAPYEGAPFLLSMTSEKSCILMGLDAANPIIGEMPLMFEPK